MFRKLFGANKMLLHIFQNIVDHFPIKFVTKNVQKDFLSK
jgi:hypothetical protein